MMDNLCCLCWNLTAAAIDAAVLLLLRARTRHRRPIADFLNLDLPTLPHTPRTVDIRLRVSGGGQTSQVYAIRQAIAKALVAYYAKYYDAASALELRQLFVAYDRTLLIADTRRSEPKKFGGHGARARRQKSYR